MKYILNLTSILKRNFAHRIHYVKYSSEGFNEKRPRLENLFFNSEVQQILKKITSINYEKIFAPSKTEIATPRYEFVTDKQLKKLQDEAHVRALKKIQMPPVMDIREPINEVLSEDPELQGFLKHRTLFIDTSPSASPRERVITVREIDGTLRKATWEERERMNQMFFPVAGRYLKTPKVFDDSNFERLLEEEEYEFILDLVCAQFEPDAPEFHKISHQTYEHIKERSQFDVLRSTRHFGPMAFYFAYTKTIDSLLLDMISRQMMSDASDTVKLLYLLNPSMAISEGVDAANDLDVVQDYIKHNSTLKDDLEMAVQTYVEAMESKAEETSS